MAENKNQDRKGGQMRKNDANFFRPNRFALIFLAVIIGFALYLVNKFRI